MKKTLTKPATRAVPRTGTMRTPEKIYRDMTLTLDRAALALIGKRDTGAEFDDRIPIAISSETPVSRFDWWDWEPYNEVLDHSASAVDLSYAADGMPFLDSHDTTQQMGLVEDVTVDNDGVMRGMVRFSQRAEAQALRQDMIDGIRNKISVGYRQLETVTTESQDDNAPDEVRVTRWLPMEASSVSIPADYSVGVGRAAAGDGADPSAVHAAIAVMRKHAPHLLSAPKAKERNVDEDETTTGPNGAVAIQARAGATNDERARVRAIDAVCGEHAIDAAVRTDLIEKGATIADAQRAVLGIVRTRLAKPTPAAAPVELSAKDQKRYSYARAILGGLEGTPFAVSGLDNGLEREVEQELEKKLPQEYKRRGGVLLPTFTTRAGLDSATTTKGKETVFAQVGEFIDLLRARMKVRALGARVLSGLTGPVSMIRQTAAASGSWVGENSAADVADSNLLLDLVTLSIKTYQASTSFSRQLLVSALSGSIDAESMVREDLALIHALAFDKAAIQGLGSSNQPKGLLSQTGIGAIASGTNGGAPTFGNIIDLETAVANANADVDNMGYLTTPVMRGKLKQTQTFSTSANGLPVWDDGEVNGYNAEVSTQVPSALVKGTSSDCHAIIFGDWAQLVLGEWGVLELITDPYRLKKQGMIEITSFQMGDVAVRTPASFAAMQDARNV